MQRFFITALAILLLVAPFAQADGVVGLGNPVSATAATAQPTAEAAPGKISPLAFQPEVGVDLLALPKGDYPSWASAPETEYDLRFVCPTPAEEAEAVPLACPAYVLDAEDILAQPSLVVDPRDDSLVAFHALHGGPGARLFTQDPLPSETSRSNAVHQPHTTFQSRDGGAFWDDNRYYSRLTGKAEVFGEDNALALDGAGRMTLASLYSFYNQTDDSAPLIPLLPPTQASNQAPGYVVYLWQSERISTPVDYDKNYVTRFAAEGHKIDSLWLANFARADAMVAAWRDVGPEGPRVMLERKSAEGQWQAWNQSAVVGACDVLSNLVPVGEELLFACAQGSDTRLWAIGTDFTVQDRGVAPIHSVTSLRLASAETVQGSGLVMAGAYAREGRGHVWVVFGVSDPELTTWGRPGDHGEQVTDRVNHQGAQLSDSRITALAFLGTSGTAHFLVQERYEGGSALDQNSEFGKLYAAVQSSGRYLGTFGIGYGDPQSRANIPATVSGLSAGAFADAHDTLFVHYGDLGEERLFIAFGDYGYVRYAEVIELDPPIPGFPPIAAPAAIPVASAATSPVVVGAVAGTLALAAAMRLALAKSKKAAEAPTL